MVDAPSRRRSGRSSDAVGTPSEPRTAILATPPGSSNIPDGAGSSTVMDVPVLADGRIVASGDKSLALKLEEHGSAWVAERKLAGAG